MAQLEFRATDGAVQAFAGELGTAPVAPAEPVTKTDEQVEKDPKPVETAATGKARPTAKKRCPDSFRRENGTA